MNNTTKTSLLLLVGALFLGACGPQMDDPAYLAQMASMDANSANSNEGEAKDMDAMPAQSEQVAGAAIAAPQAAALPTIYSQMPPRVAVDPTIITNTAEQRNLVRKISVEQPIIRNQPSLNIHNVNTNIHTEREFHTTVYNRPSFANVVRPTATATESVNVLPTTEVNVPAVGAIAPAVGAVAPALGVGIGAGIAPWGHGLWNTWGIRPKCARYLSGGFFRNCAVGPYFR